MLTLGALDACRAVCFMARDICRKQSPSSPPLGQQPIRTPQEGRRAWPYNCRWKVNDQGDFGGARNRSESDARGAARRSISDRDIL